MALKIYNTLTRNIENFEPISPPKVQMYCCGPTVYDLLHVGNFRGAVFYNLLKNHLETLGYEVNYVYNFTDIDDKIIKKAQESGETSTEIAEKYIKEFYADFNALKLKPHSLNPKVTESLEAIINVIQSLVDNEHAYVVDGEVFYSISKFKDYGKLSHRKPEELLEGTRKNVDEKKQNPLDFTLWKPAKENEQSFDSPWGRGRPGWHIECTAMIQKHLGNEIDIHGGGLDLLFPHHENEIAQSEGACKGSHYVKYWVHNNMFTFSGAKMSKSLGNIKTMRSFLEEYPGEIFKFIVLSAHYRSETEFTDKAIHKAMAGLSRIYSSLSLAENHAKNTKVDAVLKDEALEFETYIQEKEKLINEHLNNDFATPKVFSEFFEIIRKFNTLVSSNTKLTPQKKEISLIVLEFFTKIGDKFSLFLEKPYDNFLKAMDKVLLKELNLEEKEVQRLIDERVVSKSKKDYKKADEIRDILKEKGILIKDSAEGSTWEVGKNSYFKE